MNQPVNFHTGRKVSIIPANSGNLQHSPTYAIALWLLTTLSSRYRLFPAIFVNNFCCNNFAKLRHSPASAFTLFQLKAFSRKCNLWQSPIISDNLWQIRTIDCQHLPETAGISIVTCACSCRRLPRSSRDCCISRIIAASAGQWVHQPDNWGHLPDNGRIFRRMQNTGE